MLFGEAGWKGTATSIERGPVLRIAALLGIGYVLGAKAGRRRYEQIAGTYRAVTESPRTKAVMDAGRRKIADRVSPDPTMVKLTAIDAQTAVLQPETVDER
jgi:hypothetical protein